MRNTQTKNVNKNRKGLHGFTEWKEEKREEKERMLGNFLL